MKVSMAIQERRQGVLETQGRVEVRLDLAPRYAMESRQVRREVELRAVRQVEAWLRSLRAGLEVGK
jgi:hypothetical protein